MALLLHPVVVNPVGVCFEDLRSTYQSGFLYPSFRQILLQNKVYLNSPFGNREMTFLAFSMQFLAFITNLVHGHLN
jgi:hypothetical protein